MTTILEAMRNVVARYRRQRAGENLISLLENEPITQEAMRIRSAQIGSIGGIPVFQANEVMEPSDPVVPFVDMDEGFRNEYVRALERNRDSGDEDPREVRGINMSRNAGEGVFRSHVAEYGVMRMNNMSDTAPIRASKPLSKERKEIDKVRRMVTEGELTGKSMVKDIDEGPTHECRDTYQCGNRSRVPRTPVCWLRSTAMEIIRTDDLVEGLNDVIDDMLSSVNNDVDLRVVLSSDLLRGLRMRSSMIGSEILLSHDTERTFYRGVPIMSNNSLASNVGYVYCSERFVEQDGLVNPDFAHRIVVNRE